MPPSFVSESNILKPKDPSIKDNNDWEIFILANAEVRDEPSGDLTSLLNAHAATPLTVTGRLQPVKPEQNHLLLRAEHTKPTPIQIDNVCEFCYGTDEAGQILVWAAGNAGWFELRPGRAYKDIFNEIEEAVNIQFFIEDVYEQGRSKPGNGPSAEMIFRELAEDDRFTCATPRDAADMVARHRNFLLMQMFKPNKRVPWIRTPLYSHLKTKFPTDFQAMKSKHDGKAPSQNGKTQGKTRRSTESDVSMSDEQSSRSSLKSAKPKPTIPAPKKDAAYWKAKVVWELMQRAHTQGHVDASDMTISDVATILYHRYEIESPEAAASFIRAHTSILRYMMEQKTLRMKAGVQWIDIPIFKELGSARTAAAKLRQVSDVELKARKIPLQTKASTPEEDDHSSAPELDNRETRLRRRAHKGKSSVLRPKSTRFSGKGKGIARFQGPKGPARNSSPDASDDEDAASINTPSKRKGNFGDDLPPTKRMSRRLRNMSTTSISSQSPTSGAEPTDSEVPSIDSNEEGEDDDDEEGEGEEDVGEEEDEDGEEDHGHDTAPSSLSSTLPLHLRPVKGPPNSSATHTQGIVSSPLPSVEPNQPGDIWLCTFDGCSHRVYGASEPESKDLIHEHVEWHDKEDVKQREKLALVVREGELGGRLPVNNLIQRIREMTEAQQNILQPLGNAAAAIKDIAFPDAIKRRY